MIKHSDFIQILEALLRSFDGSIRTDVGAVAPPKNIRLIDKIQLQIKDKKFVVLEDITAGLQMKFKNNDHLSLIKKADFGKADPPLYFKQGSKWALDFKTSAIILLTDFAFYLYQNAVHKRMENDLNSTDPVYKHFKALCRDVDCFSELWLHKEMNLFALIDRVEEKIYFVTDTAEQLYSLDKLFPQAPLKKAKEKDLEVSDFLLDSRIKNDDLYARVKIAGHEEPVEVIFESEEKKEDFSEEIEFCKKIISRLTIQKQEQLLKHVAEEITDAAFNQSSKGKEKQSSLNELKNDLKIKDGSIFIIEIFYILI